MSAEFDIVNAFDIGDIGFYSGVGKPALLADGLRLILKRIRARIIIYLILPVIRIDGQNRRVVKNMHETGRDVDGFNALALILSERLLFVSIGDFKFVAGEK